MFISEMSSIGLKLRFEAIVNVFVFRLILA